MENKKSYLQGFLTGGAVVLVLCVIACGLVFWTPWKSPGAGSHAQTSESGHGSIEDLVKDKNVVRKLGLIAELMDEYYYEEIDLDQVEQYLYKGLIAGVGDPYSAYYTKEETEKMTESITGIYSGVGITMTLDQQTGYAQVVKVNKNSPAAEAGVLAGDYIYEVEGENMGGKDTSDVASVVRGEDGTTVDVTFLRGTEFVETTLERRKIEEETVEWQMLEKNTGYVLVTKFDVVTSKSFMEAMEELKAQGMERLIVDLRDNPGGSVDTAKELGEYLIPKGLLTYIQDAKGNRKEYECSGELTWEGPLVLLVNGNSASASEIIAGAVKDYGNGTLVGTKTYGKGIVQTSTRLNDGSSVKYTFAKYYTPKGDNIHGTGIQPDVEIELDKEALADGYSIEKDNQVRRALEVLDKPLTTGR